MLFDGLDGLLDVADGTRTQVTSQTFVPPATPACFQHEFIHYMNNNMHTWNMSRESAENICSNVLQLMKVVNLAKVMLMLAMNIIAGRDV